MIKKAATRRTVAWFFLGVFTIETFIPTKGWALTSGPKQPETQQFAAAGTSDMVDLFSGDFKYNIPLLDVDGYPVNLNYASGVGMEDEASWVGLGWNLNVGAVNRQLRGIADDANGDEVEYEDYMKPKVTVGGRINSRVELAGFQAIAGLGGSLAVGIFSDNYTGYGADIGVGTNVSVKLAQSGSKTAGLSLGGGLSLNSNTQSGVSVSPSISLSVKKEAQDKSSVSAGLSANLGYNTREGLKELSLGLSFSGSGADEKKNNGDDVRGGSASYGATLSSISYNTPAFYPRSQVAFNTSTTTYSGDLGGAISIVYLGGGVTGYKTVREVADPISKKRAFGFMYAERGKQQKDALMDFMREKDNPVVPNLPNLAVPISTPDIFSASSQAGGGQFRLYRNGAGTVADAEAEDKSVSGALSAEYGFGALFHAGFSFSEQNVNSKTSKWGRNNSFLAKGDYPATSSPEEEPAYFKMVGERNMDNQSYNERVLDNAPARIALNGKSLSGQLALKNGKYNPLNASSTLKKDGRQLRSSPVLALTANEIVEGKIGKPGIEHYPFNDISNFPENITSIPQPLPPLPRISNTRKGSHISEIITQGNNGGRLVYGLPVYNTSQEEYTFSVPAGASKNKNENTVEYDFDNSPKKKIIHKHPETNQYYHSEKQPSYTTAHLLTGVLSPDYVDLTNDGISDDDPGTAIKFNYSKVAEDYKWRAPYVESHAAGKSKAQYNPGQLADDSDDKGNIIFGTKELWYLNSIESKTKIAFFITKDRDDALGAVDIHGGKSTASKQKRLEEIRIYSKTDLTTPIKTVVFKYDYGACTGVPNFFNTDPNATPAPGKLRLTKVYFKYNKNGKGEYHPYEFTYANNPQYKPVSTDRWGTYKSTEDNTADGFPDLLNNEFPYTSRGQSADNNAGAWLLSKISLPSGGEINVDYESDSYSWVQDRKAMQMMKIVSLLNDAGNATASLMDATGLEIQLPAGVPSVPSAEQKDWFIRNILNGKPYLYTKLFVNVSDKPASDDEKYFDYVLCYGEVAGVSIGTGGTVKVQFKTAKPGTVRNRGPFVLAAWQKMRLDYPMYAYPGYKNRINDNRPVQAAVSALTNAIGNMSELRMNFNQRAELKKFAEKVKLGKSFARLGVMTDKKGGGTRVKKVTIEDKWSVMAEGGTDATYGQSYDYTMQDPSNPGTLISSGVASYEPSVGADENPMRMPVPYSQEFKMALTNSFYLEEPFGEALFPGPQVGYKKVTVKNIGNGSESDKMGTSVMEYYTAKEFPVVIDQTSPEKIETETKRWYPFFGADYAHELYVSQGYVMHLNDMHGKPFRETIKNQRGETISSVEYQYRTTTEGGHLRLNNAEVPVVQEYMKVNNGYMGREVEVFTDLREEETISTDKQYNAGLDVITLFALTVPLPHIPLGRNNDYKLFRSASLMKTIQEYGILEKVIKTVNGSSITTSTELFDQETGEVVVSKTQNEFEDPVYTVSIPAYYAHNGMGLAYKTLGLLIPELNTDINGVITGAVANLLQPGDELVDFTNGNRSWVVLSASNGNGTPQKRLVDVGGRLRKMYGSKARVCRSGYRNILSAAGATFVSLKNPAENMAAFFNEVTSQDYPMLDAKATLYNEAWGRPSDCKLQSCPDGYNESEDGRCMMQAWVNPDAGMNVVAGDYYNGYGSHGAEITRLDNGQQERKTNGFWSGGGNANLTSRLNLAGIWLQGLSQADTEKWWGIEHCFNVLSSGYYYVGYASDNRGYFYIDNIPVSSTNMDSHENWTSELWRVSPMYLTAGNHVVRIEAANAAGNGSFNPRSVALEVYNANTATILAGSTAIGYNIMFSTKDLRGVPNLRTYRITAPNGTRSNQKLYCPSGKTLSAPCDGTPNCGFKEKGDCPDGYVKSADGQSCYLPVINYPGADLDLSLAPDHIDYDKQGGYLMDSEAPAGGQKLNTVFFGGDPNQTCGYEGFSALVSDTYCGRLNSCGIKLGGYNNPGVTSGFKACIDIPQSKVYYVGFSGNRYIEILMDGAPLLGNFDLNGREKWKVYPIDFTAGKHTFTVKARSPNSSEDAVMGMEIYDVSRANLINSGIQNTIWSTASIPPGNTTINQFAESFPSGSLLVARNLCGNEVMDPCTGCGAIPNGPVINPYVTGNLGNWRSWKDYVYMDKRIDNGVFIPNNNNLNIRKSSTYTVKVPFYLKPATGGYQVREHTTAIPGWTVAREITMHDRDMQEVENKDALDRYSSVRYGFRGTLPLAVASNARHREIYYDGFEDYKFYNNPLAKPVCDVGEFDIRKSLGTNYESRLEASDAHTGRYSLRLNSNINLSTWVFNDDHKPGIYLSNNVNGEFYRSIAPWLGLWGFAPKYAKQYVFSAWVKDGQPLANTTGLTLTFNGNAVTLTRKATVEGWKLVEGTIVTPATAEGLQQVEMVLQGGANMLLDDIRIFPFDAHIKTYTYDDRTLRVMGELDENNYATYYEYDDEGSLTRVKKETEKGIITIKESRTSYKKKPINP